MTKPRCLLMLVVGATVVSSLGCGTWGLMFHDPEPTVSEAQQFIASAEELGSSRPWPAALALLNGESKMDATAILDYFAPLKTWLDTQPSPTN